MNKITPEEIKAKNLIAKLKDKMLNDEEVVKKRDGKKVFIKNIKTGEHRSLSYLEFVREYL